MILKKANLIGNLFGFRSYEIDFDDYDDLRKGLISLCDLLKKDFFVIETVSNALVADAIEKSAIQKMQFKNRCFFFVSDLGFLTHLDFSKECFLTVYTISEDCLTAGSANQIMKSAGFSLCIDDYSLFASVTLRKKQYGENIFKRLQEPF